MNDSCVADMNVIKSWFGYRKHQPTGRKSSPLDDISTASWKAKYTVDLIDLLHVLTLLVREQPAQRQLLDNVLADQQITRKDLEDMQALPSQTGTRAKPPEFKRTVHQPTLPPARRSPASR